MSSLISLNVFSIARTVHASKLNGYATTLNPMSSSSFGVQIGVDPPPSNMLAIFGTFGVAWPSVPIGPAAISSGMALSFFTAKEECISTPRICRGSCGEPGSFCRTRCGTKRGASRVSRHCFGDAQGQGEVTEVTGLLTRML